MAETINTKGRAVTIYATFDGLDAYLSTADRFYRAWTSISDEDEKKRKAVEATRYLNKRPWKGTKTSDAQPLALPREGFTDGGGNAIANNVTPADVEEAFFILVGLLCLNPNLLGSGQTPAPVQSFREGPVSVSFYPKPQPLAPETSGAQTVDEVEAIIAQYLGAGPSESLGSLMAGLASGTDGESAFEDDKRYTMEGLS